MTRENDIVLIYMEDTPTLFARIEDIGPDVKPNWFQVTLLLLQVPLQVVTWILREPYINGEPFTMGGRAMRLERVDAPIPKERRSETDGDAPASELSDPPDDDDAPASTGKVISLSDLKKR